jgi:hypothetical protein
MKQQAVFSVHGRDADLRVLVLCVIREDLSISDRLIDIVFDLQEL